MRRSWWLQVMLLGASLSCSKPAPTLPLTWRFSGTVENAGDSAKATSSGPSATRIEPLSTRNVDLELRIETATVVSGLVSGPSPVQVDVSVRRLSAGLSLSVEGLDQAPSGRGATPTAAPELVWSFTLAVKDASGKLLQRMLIIATPSGPARVAPLRIE